MQIGPNNPYTSGITQTGGANQQLVEGVNKTPQAKNVVDPNQNKIPEQNIEAAKTQTEKPTSTKVDYSQIENMSTEDANNFIKENPLELYA